MNAVARAAVLAAIVAITTTGCRGHSDTTPPTIDATAVQHELRSYAVQTYPGREVGVVTCPKHEAIAANRRFVCTATVASEPVRIEVTEADATGNHITFIPLDAIVDVPTAIPAIAGQVAPAFTGTVSVDCGKTPVLVVEPGQSFPCTGTDPLGHTKPITVEVKDLDGSLAATVG